jgi:hypothetical protein
MKSFEEKHFNHIFASEMEEVQQQKDCNLFVAFSLFTAID